MSYTFRRAVRENVTLLIGLAGASGGGKTYTAMRLAAGIAGDAPFAVIDTEARRALHYADRFRFDHMDLQPPFEPKAYAEAIKAADDAKYPVVVVDSCSHEHAGIGGILDMQEAEHKRLGGSESVKMLSWVKPKGEHRKMVQQLLQVRAHLILCFRAEEKIEMARDEKTGKVEVRKKQTVTGIDGWVPICEKTLPYELTCSFLLMASKPGVPLPIKLQEQHKPLFPLTEPITEASGQRLAEWARGGTTSQAGPSGQGEAARLSAPVSSRREGEGTTGAPAARAALLNELKALVEKHYGGISDADKKRRQDLLVSLFGLALPFKWQAIEALDLDRLRAGVTTLRQRHAEPAA